MRASTRTTAKGITSGVVAGLCWIAVPYDAHGQSALCPSVVNPPADAIHGDGPVRRTGFVSVNGFCANDLAGFSGAALASQSLSELSQTTTQETTRTTGNAISDRREAERERCAEGFSRVNGTCERNPPPAPRAERVEAAPAPEAAEEPARKKGKKAKAEAVAPTKKRPAPAKAARLAPLPPPPPPPPVFVEAPVRFGAWTQAFGDYEHRDATGAATIPAVLLGGAVVPVPLDLTVQSRTGTVGFEVGGDFTSRGVLFGGDGLIVGGLSGYVSTNLTLNTTSNSSNQGLAGNSFANLTARASGPIAGVYATYFNGGFSADVLLKVDVLTLDENFNENIAFVPGVRDVPTLSPFTIPFAGSGSTSLLNATVAANLNYRFDLYPNFWVEPTVGAQYTNTSYGPGAAAIGLDDGTLVMVQGGARFGTATPIDNHILMTTTLTGLAYDDVVVRGGFIPGAGYGGNNILAQADRGQVRGRGVLALNFDFGQGIKSFVQGEVRGGQGLFGAGGKAGVRVEW